MLEKIIINNRKVPVPIPIKRVSELFDWLEGSIIPDGHFLTKLRIDGDDIDFETSFSDNRYDRLHLSSSNKIEITIDSPFDLTIQCLETAKNLSMVILQALRPIAVKCWQLDNNKGNSELDSVLSDLSLMNQMLDNSINIDLKKGYLERGVLLKSISVLQHEIDLLYKLKEQADWKNCAKSLLNKIEPILKVLSEEINRIQTQTVELKNG